MQRINRSAHAPVGTAVFLFLGLAILPVSLRVAGVQLCFSPRLSAAADAWQQIADVFGATYNPAPASELCVVKDLDIDPSSPIETYGRPSSEFACVADLEKAPAVCGDTRARTPKAAPALRTSRRSESARLPVANRVAFTVAAEVIKASFETHAPAIDALRAMRIDTATRTELVKDIQKQVFRLGFEPADLTRNLPLPRNLRLVVQMKRGTAGLLPKTAERKVYSALASARRQECERAGLTVGSPASPDNSEF